MTYLDLVPEAFGLETGGWVAPRADFTHPAAACEYATGTAEGWTLVRKRWAVRYCAPPPDFDPCYGDGDCSIGDGGGCGCFEIRTWPDVRHLPPEQRQPVWWMP